MVYRFLTASQGMIKMYLAEVLSKFPVVQHFPFGSLFSWERDPGARVLQMSAPVSNQSPPQAGQNSDVGTAAPWAGKQTTMLPPPTTSFGRPSASRTVQPAVSGRGPPIGAQTAFPSRGAPPITASRSDSKPSDTNLTRAPWAK